MRRLGTAFRGLRWKLTLSYMAVTVAALLVVTLVVSFFIFSFVLLPDDILTPVFWVDIINKRLVPSVGYVMAEEPVDVQAISNLLANIQPTLADSDLLTVGDAELLMRTTAQLDVLILGSDGTLLGATTRMVNSGARVGRPFDVNRIPGLKEPLQAALAGETDPNRLSRIHEAEYELIVAVPVYGYREDDMHRFSRQVIGAIAVVFESLPTQSDIPAHTLQLLSKSLLVFLSAAGVMAAVFGYLTARGLASRFDRLSSAADAWSRGEFTEFVEDPSGDELAQLADRLNLMAKQLQDLLEEGQEVAIYEERSRLARDLHDAVTQTLFSASLLAEALPEVWESDQEEARQLLLELQLLNRGAMAEMRTLLLELRPATLVDANLGALLRQLGEAAAGRVGVPVKVLVESCFEPVDQVPALPADVHVALYRIAQEALNNVVKHSRAREVEINLYCTPTAAGDGLGEAVVLFIHDDGCGFDLNDVPPDRLGLGIIRERAESIGAKLKIESEPGQGTQVLVVWISEQG